MQKHHQSSKPRDDEDDGSLPDTPPGKKAFKAEQASGYVSLQPFF
jgi:hypothetical protein